MEFESLLLEFASGVFCSAEQPVFRRNKPYVSSIPSSAKLFLIVFVSIVALKHIIIKTVILFIYVAQDCAELIFFRSENNLLTVLLTPAKIVADVNFLRRNYSISLGI